MAGSVKFFRYVADDGEAFALLRDESNVEAINSGAGISITPNEKYKLPGNVKPRKAVFQNTAGTIRREIVVLNPTIFGAITPATSITDQVSGDPLQLKRLVGEVVTLPNLADTGLNDGDAP